MERYSWMYDDHTKHTTQQPFVPHLRSKAMGSNAQAYDGWVRASPGCLFTKYFWALFEDGESGASDSSCVW
jgi:hypothetical protein